MSTPTVSAVCPGCKTTLRIPADWAGKAVKCKKCGVVVRATGAGTGAAPTPAPRPAVVPAPAALLPPAAYTPPGYGVPPGYPTPAYVPPPVGDEPFGDGFSDAVEDGRRRSRRDEDDDHRPPRKRKYKKSSGAAKWIVLGVFGALLAGGGLFAALKWDSISAALGMKVTPTQEKEGSPGPLNPNPTPNAGTTPGKTGLTATPVFPRRMLVLSSTKYLYCNPLTDGISANVSAKAGQKSVPQSELSAVTRRVAQALKVPMDPDNDQLYLVTDGGGNLEPTFATRPMLKSVVETTLARFCTACRPQDRAVIYFGGHAVAKDGKAYLVPADGDTQEADGEGLIPLEAFWKTLADCPAQQKVVLFDVCRLNEDGDVVRPGSEPMSKELQDLLHAPPKGVEVVTACSEGQTAREFRRKPDVSYPAGSAFLHALREALVVKDGVPVPADADDPIPVAQWAAAAQERLKVRFGDTAPTLKHTAGEKAAAVAAVPTEPAPKRVEYAAAPKGADAKEVKALFDALALAPIKVDEDAREEAGPGDDIADVVFFPADALAAYKTDMTPEEAEKAGDKFPVRAAAARALKLIRDKWAKDKATSVQTRFTGQANDAVKKSISARQNATAFLEIDFQELIDEMEPLGKELDKEESPYWRATFLYAQAQVKARYAFLSEYNLALGRIKTESLPDVSDKALGLQLTSVEKMDSKKAVKEIAAAAKETFSDLIAKHKGTPWAVLAKQYRAVALGLKWQEYKPPAMAAKDKDD